MLALVRTLGLALVASSVAFGAKAELTAGEWAALDEKEYRREISTEFGIHMPREMYCSRLRDVPELPLRCEFSDINQFTFSIDKIDDQRLNFGPYFASLPEASYWTSIPADFSPPFALDFKPIYFVTWEWQSNALAFCVAGYEVAPNNAGHFTVALCSWHVKGGLSGKPVTYTVQVTDRGTPYEKPEGFPHRISTRFLVNVLFVAHRFFYYY